MKSSLLLLLSGLGILLMGLPNIATQDGALILGPIHTDKVQAFWAGVLCLATSTIFLGRQRESNDQLRSRLAESQRAESRSGGAIRALVSHQLDPLVRRLDLTSSERVSLFVRQGDLLVLVGRRSPWSKLEEASGAPIALTFGCAGEAWREKVAYGTTDTDARANVEVYAKEQQARWGIAIDDAIALGMKSRTYAGVRVDSNGPVAKRLGVLVVESTRTAAEGSSPQLLRPPKLEIEEIVARVREVLPSLRAALDALETG